MDKPQRRRLTGPATRVRLAGAVAALAAVALAGCSTPGTSGGDKTTASSSGEATTITAPVTAEQVSELGDVTLTVWADQGEQDLMKVLIPKFEAEYTNVKVSIQYKSFDDLTATVLNAMNSPEAPDVTQGNQGWATDGALVKAGLIRPLDDVAEAYDYLSRAGEAVSQLQWSEDGASFGTGSVYGMSPDNQMVGIFYNKAMLSELGLQVPKTYADFVTAVQTAKAAGKTAIVLGNSDKATAMQAFSVVQGALTSPADTVAWITGQEGASFDKATNKVALDQWAAWAQDGSISAGYDGVSPDDAAANFAKGDGLFYLGGNWQAATIADGEQFGFIATPPGPDGFAGSNGSFGMPWHISSKSKVTLAAIAFVGMVNSSDTAADLMAVHRVPIGSQTPPSDDAMFADLITASTEQLGGGNSLYWYDWATDTMFDTFTASLQEVMAGKTTAEDMLATVQQDWTDFQATR